MLMRMEDLDGPRVRPGMVEAALRDLEWLGLDWDGPVELQSEGLEQIRAAATDLLERGLAYPCVCTRGELRAASAPHAGEGELRYPGTCRGRFDSLETAESRSGRPAGVRFRVPAGTVKIRDGFAPPLSVDVEAEVGDFLIGRRDGTPAYQLAVVVDDARQGVTEVLRGDDLMPSTARQWHLQCALGLPHPEWFHVPLVTDAGGRRLAKRADDLSLSELRETGVDPRVVVSWAARSAGLDVPKRIVAGEVISIMDLTLLPREPVRLEPETVARLKGAGA